MSKKKRYLLSLLSGFLMVLSFPYSGSMPFISFFSWVPILIVENLILKNNIRSKNILIHALIAFIIYNTGASWWIWNADELGAILAIFTNTILMSFAFYIFHLTRKYIGQKQGLISLPFIWISFEFVHFHWEISWPWLTLGNVFSVYPSWVQWYEYTGVLGGSLWVLIINLLLFQIVNIYFFNKQSFVKEKRRVITFILVLLLPLSYSLYSYISYVESYNPASVLLIQPNVDPYNEKFSGTSFNQLDEIIDMAETNLNSNYRGMLSEVDFIIAPETAISRNIVEQNLTHDKHMEKIKSWMKHHSNFHFLIGSFTVDFFDTVNSRASQEIPDSDQYIEYYNSSLGIENNKPTQIIHKSKLVPGVEQVPFGSWLQFLDEFSNDNGGISGSLGIENEAKVISSMHGIYAPSICYESIYGGFIAEQCRKGAEMIFVITNDGWWGNTAGHKQHFSFSRLRAIENRRSVARSANTGVTGIINQRGDVIKKTKWWTKDIIRGTINKNDQITFYTKYGNVIGRSFSFVSVLLLLYLFVSVLKKKIGVK